MKKKRLIVGFLAAILCCSIAVAGCMTPDPKPGPGSDSGSDPGPGPDSGSDPIEEVLGIDTWVESSYVNVLRDFTLEENDAKTANFVTAKNEYESVQIVLRSSKTFTIKDVQFTDLTCGDNTIDKSNLKYNYVEYYRAVFNSPNVAESSLVSEAPDYFPDALSNEKEMEVDALDAQPIWIRLYVPRETVAGDYTGKVTVVTNKGNIDVPVKAEVNDVVVPDAGSNDSQYDLIFWQLMIGAGFGKTYADSHTSDPIVKLFGCERWTEKWWKIVGDIATVMKENRLNTLYLPTVQLLLDGGSVRNEDGTWTFNFSKFDEYVQYFLDRGIVNRFMGYMMMTGGTTNCIIREANGRSCTGRIKFDSADSDAWFDAYLPALYAHLHEKGWDTRWTQCLRDEPPTDSESVAQYKKLAETYKRHMPGVAFGDPTQTNENSSMLLEMNAPTLIPVIGICNDHPTWYQNLNENQRVYTYSCVIPQGTYLNRFIDMPVYYGRSIAWWNYNVGANGFLHWGLMAWYRPITDFALGDTASIYADVENNTIKSSIRMENLRDGAEEYELLKMLEKVDPGAAKTLVERVASDAKTNYCKDTDELAEVRAMLIRALGGKSGIIGKPESVTLSEETLSLLVTENATLKATLLPEDSISKDLVWSSDNPDVVSVNQSGEIWANAAGTAVITVASKDYPEVKDTVTVTVTAPDPSQKVLIVPYKDAYVRGGAYADYRFGTNGFIDICKSNADNTYSGYMSFDANGFKNGVTKAVIRVYADTIEKSAARTIALYECASEWSETTLSKNTAPDLGKKITQLVVENNTGAVRKGWLEFDITDYFKTIENGVFTVCFVDESGTATNNNRVRINTRENSLNRPTLVVTGQEMNYAPEAVTGINIDASLSLKIGESYALQPSVLPTGAPQQRYRFESADTSVAAVSSTGVIVALKKGSVKITVTSLDNPAIKAECNVTVSEDDRIKTFFATDDATIESHRPDMNFGAQGSFLTNFKDPKRRAVIQFNVIGLTKPVASVRLRLYVSISGMAASNEFKVYLNNGTFSENTVTYGTAPKTGKEVGSYTVNNSQPSIYGGYFDWITVDLDPSCVAGDGTVSFTLVATSGDRVNFSSRNSAQCPMLEIDYGAPVTSIELGDKVIERPGLTVKLEPIVTPAINHEAIVYESSDPSVATVDANGVVTGVAEGEATITARSGSASATCKVTVKNYINVTLIALNKTELTLAPTGSEKLTLTYLPENANMGLEYVWESSNTEVANVTKDGTVIARFPGTTVITVSSKEFPAVKATCTVTVQAKENTSVFVPTKDAAVETHIDTQKGKIDQLYTYTSNRYSVVEFTTEKLTLTPIGLTLKLHIANALKSNSTTEVYLATNKAWDEATINRGNAPEKTGNKIGSLAVASTASGWVEIAIDPSVLPEEGGTLTLILWNSGKTGKYYHSRESVYSPILIINYGDPVTAIEAENAEIVRPGLTVRLEPTVTPAENHRPLSYVSENPEIATVDVNGVVTGVAAGEVTITISSGSVSTTCKVTVGPYVNVTGITLNKTELTLAPTESDTLTVETVTPDNANFGLEYVWESSDSNVAYVIPNKGEIVARLPGTATITVRSKDFDSVTATCTVTVRTEEHLAVAIPDKDASIETHRDVRLGLKDHLYTYTNPNRYSVLEFTTEKLKKTPISAKLRLRILNTLGKDATTHVYLGTNTEWDEETVYRANAPVKTGSSLGGLVVKGNATGWVEFSVNTSVLNAEGGKLTLILWNASADGTGTYYYSKDSAYAPVLIINYGETVTDIAVSDLQATAGLTYRIVPQVTPAENHEKLYYSSSNEEVATIDANGIVKALTVGTATITVRNDDGSVSKTCTIMVSAVPENQQKLSPVLDATLNGSGAGSNYGSNNNLHTIKSSNMHFLIVFDLSAVEGNVTKLTLRMQLNSVGAPSQTLGLYYAPTTAIAENAVKYNTWNGNYGEKIMEYIVSGKTSGDFLEIEIDPAKLEGITDGKLGIVFKLEESSPDNARCSFWSKEEKNNVKPMLIVETEPSGGVTSDPAPETEETV